MELKITKARLVRIEKAYAERNMGESDLKTIKNTRRGLIEFEGKEYYFVANTNMRFPVVFGATPEIMYETLKALDNKMQEYGSDKTFFKNPVKSAEEIIELKNVYYKENTMIIKSNNKYIGFMPGAAGLRAICYRQGDKHYSCSVKSLIKNLEPERLGSMSFRQMMYQGEKIRLMIDDFNKIIKELDNKNNIENNTKDDAEDKKISINKRNRKPRERKVEKEEIKIKEQEDVKTTKNKEEKQKNNKRNRRRGDDKLEAKREAIRQRKLQESLNEDGDDNYDEKELF